MARDFFEKKLERMIIECSMESEKKFKQKIKSLADIVSESISYEEYEIQDFLDTLKYCKDCAKTYDAADNLCRYVFQNEKCKKLANNALIKTIKCTWDYDYEKFKREINNIFIQEKLNVEKGFVYIFWSASKLEYLYVGKADPEKNPINRLKCFTHNSVALSISADQATRLSVIYPSNRNMIKDVEASIIRTIGIKKLKHNKKEEPFTEGNSILSQKLSKLEKFFSQLYNKFSPAYSIN